MKREAISPSYCKRRKYKTKAYAYCAHPVSDRELIPKGGFIQKADPGEHNCRFGFTVANKNEPERKVNGKFREERKLKT